MKPRLVPLLRCPACQGPLRLEGVEKEDEGEVVEGTLLCAAGHRYAVRDGVPRMVSEAGYDRSHTQTRESFSAKWKKYGEAAWQAGAYVDFQRQWFFDRYQFESPDKLSAFLASRRLVLDAGCGVGMAVGWFADAMREGDVVGVDIGDAVDVAYKRIGHRPNVHIVQGDISSLPFAPGTFGYVSCDQVIHHTVDPPATFRHLVERLAVGGAIGIYAYRKKGPVREFSDDLIRARATKMSVEECVELSEAITEFGRALSQLNAKVTIPRDVPILEIPAGTYDVQRLFYWHVFKCFWNEEMGWDVSVATNFDWYHPEHAYRYTLDELREWYAKAGLRLESTHAIESGYTLRGAHVG